MSGPHPFRQVRNATTSPTPEEVFGYHLTGYTGFRLRSNLVHGRETPLVELQPGSCWQRALLSLDAFQWAWITLRARYSLGVSQCASGDFADGPASVLPASATTADFGPHANGPARSGRPPKPLP